jgi:hypothetical protein
MDNFVHQHFRMLCMKWESGGGAGSNLDVGNELSSKETRPRVVEDGVCFKILGRSGATGPIWPPTV